MKKQNNPSMKAHLLWSALILLSLLAVCAIPFALAQRNATNQTVTNRSAGQSMRLSADAASSALVATFGKRSIQFHKSPLRPSGNILWYNGDFNGVNGLANEENTS